MTVERVWKLSEVGEEDFRIASRIQALSKAVENAQLTEAQVYRIVLQRLPLATIVHANLYIMSLRRERTRS